jgi:chemotaxis response regulator CheB
MLQDPANITFGPNRGSYIASIQPRRLPHKQTVKRTSHDVGGTFTVLVVNEEPLLHRILHASLRSSGFVVEKARTAEEALAVVRERTFEVACFTSMYREPTGSTSVGKCAPGESIGIVMVSALGCRERHGSGARVRQNLQARVDEV